MHIATISLYPATGTSSASVALTASATASAYEGSALTIQPNTAAELHPHTYPPSMFDAIPLLAVTGAVVFRNSFRYHRNLDGSRDACCGSQMGHEQIPKSSKT